jgi:hypothetical protein
MSVSIESKQIVEERGFFNFFRSSKKKDTVEDNTDKVASKNIGKESSQSIVKEHGMFNVIGSAPDIFSKILEDFKSETSEESELVKNISAILDKLGAQATLLLAGENGLSATTIAALRKGIENWIAEWAGEESLGQDSNIPEIANKALAHATETTVQAAMKGFTQAVVIALQGEAKRIQEGTVNVVDDEIVLNVPAQPVQSKLLIEAVNEALNKILGSNILCTAEIASRILLKQELQELDRGLIGALEENAAEATSKILFNKKFEELDNGLAGALEETVHNVMQPYFASFIEISKSIEETRQKVDKELPRIAESLERIGLLAAAIARILNAISDFFAQIFSAKKEVSVAVAAVELKVSVNDVPTNANDENELNNPFSSED